MSTAHIEHFAPPVAVEEVDAQMRAVLSCGCSLFVGTDGTDMVGVVARACMEPHQRLVDLALATLHTDGSVPAVALACRAALLAAQHEIRPWIGESDD